MKVKAPFRIFGPLDEHTRGNLERWLRRGPQYDSVSYAGRDVLLLWEGEVVSKIVGPFGEQAHELAEFALRFSTKWRKDRVEDGPKPYLGDLEQKAERETAIGSRTHRPKFLR